MNQEKSIRHITCGWSKELRDMEVNEVLSFPIGSRATINNCIHRLKDKNCKVSFQTVQSDRELGYFILKRIS